MATVRPAVPADAAELTRLRALMFAAMGAPDGDPRWQAEAEQAFGRRTGSPGFRAYVVEGGSGLVACGAGWVEEHLPSPGSPTGGGGTWPR